MNYLNPVARMGYAPNRLVPLRRSSAETKNRYGKMHTLRCRLSSALGCSPSHAHYVRDAQPRGLGLKVSDEI